MSRRGQTGSRAQPTVRPRCEAALKIDPEFADRLRHVMYDRDAGCPNCRYNLSGIVDDRCPECGIRLGDYLRVADTTPWRIPARIRALRLRRFFEWIVAPLVGAMIVLLGAWVFLTWP